MMFYNPIETKDIPRLVELYGEKYVRRTILIGLIVEFACIAAALFALFYVLGPK